MLMNWLLTNARSTTMYGNGAEQFVNAVFIDTVECPSFGRSKTGAATSTLCMSRRQCQPTAMTIGIDTSQQSGIAEDVYSEVNVSHLIFAQSRGK